jgi:hypothetical protein
MIQPACTGAGARSRVEPATPAPALPVSACARRTLPAHKATRGLAHQGSLAWLSGPASTRSPVPGGDFFAASRSEAKHAALAPASASTLSLTTAHGAAAAAAARHSASCCLASASSSLGRSIINAFLVLVVCKRWSYHPHQPLAASSQPERSRSLL